MKLHINKEIFKLFCGSVAFAVCLSFGAKKIIDSNSCQINDNHAHKYTSLNGLQRYVVSENTFYEFMLRSKEVKYLNDDELKFINYLDDNDLYIIEDNIDLIKGKMEYQKDFTEYQYEEEKENNKGNKYKVTKWSRLSFKSNGYARDCYYLYEAYKITEKDGEYYLEKSDPVNNILDIKDDYPYIKVNYYKVIKGDIYKVNDDNKIKLKTINS